VLFDVDDTLVDNRVVPITVERACTEIAGELEAVDAGRLLEANLAAWNGYWPEAEPRTWMGELDLVDVSREVWRRALVACGIEDPACVECALDTHQRIAADLARCFDDVDDLLRTLDDARVATALVTNSSPTGQLARLRDVGLGSAFEVVIISGAVGVAKPDPAIFHAALESLGVAPEEAWHVGDSLATDVAGAAAAGIRSVWLNRRGRARRPGDPRPDAEITTLRDLEALATDG
jgi:putative hydrolase of the HAD superfamily